MTDVCKICSSPQTGGSVTFLNLNETKAEITGIFYRRRMGGLEKFRIQSSLQPEYNTVVYGTNSVITRSRLGPIAYTSCV